MQYFGVFYFNACRAIDWGLCLGPADGDLLGGLRRAGKAVEDGEGRLSGEAGLSRSQRPPRFSFLRQGNSSSDTRDMYVPNPSCKDFAKYEWIGQLMGAALRSKEILVSMAQPARGFGKSQSHATGPPATTSPGRPWSLSCSGCGRAVGRTHLHCLCRSCLCPVWCGSSWQGRRSSGARTSLLWMQSW